MLQFSEQSASIPNPAHSQAIYQKFCIGSVINRQEYKSSVSDFIESPLYQEIIQNEPHYKTLYMHLGYELCRDSEGDYFYIKENVVDENEGEEFDEASLKIIAILTIFSKCATTRGQALQFFSSPLQGITPDDIEWVNGQDELMSYLKAIKLKSASDAMDFLRKRGFAFKTTSNRSILSKGAMVMIMNLIEREEQLQQQEYC